MWLKHCVIRWIHSFLHFKISEIRGVLVPLQTRPIEIHLSLLGDKTGTSLIFKNNRIIYFLGPAPRSM